MRMARASVWVGRASWCVVLLCLACDSGAPTPVLDLPPRPSDAPGGAEIARDVRGLTLEGREERIFAEIARGNVPSWLRPLAPVEMSREIDGRDHHATLWVTPDYLAVGSDSDFFLVPLSPGTAQRIADLVGGSLPTPQMVDSIWVSARSRLAPIRIPPDEFTTTVQYFVRHSRLVQAQRSLLKVRPGAFVAGHKVDLVLSSGLTARAGTAAAYGWHRPDGEPIQPLYMIPEDSQVPYNQGIRLVDRRVLVDGATRDLVDVLRDPELVLLLSSDSIPAK
jgi:hypothetical protein